MAALANIDKLLELLTERVELLIKDREELSAEFLNRSAALVERDEECVRLAQDRHKSMEIYYEDELRRASVQTVIESKLQVLNQRLIDLVAERRQV